MKLVSIRMTAIAVIEDEGPISQLYVGWLAALADKYENFSVDAYLDRESAEIGLLNKKYDLVLLDIQLGLEKNAGIGIKSQLLTNQDVPVIVISGLPADVYRNIMTEMKAWDYLEKPVNQDSFLSLMVRTLRKKNKIDSIESDKSVRNNDSKDELNIDPLHRKYAEWKGKRLSLPMCAQRIANYLYQNRNRLVKFEELYELMPSAKNKIALRGHIKIIKDEISSVDSAFDSIKAVPMAGYRWDSSI